MKFAKSAFRPVIFWPTTVFAKKVTNWKLSEEEFILLIKLYETYSNWPTFATKGKSVLFHWKSERSRRHLSWSSIHIPTSRPFPRKNCSKSVVWWLGRLLYRQSDNCNVDIFWMLASLKRKKCDLSDSEIWHSIFNYSISKTKKLTDFPPLEVLPMFRKSIP